MSEKKGELVLLGEGNLTVSQLLAYLIDNEDRIKSMVFGVAYKDEDDEPGPVRIGASDIHSDLLAFIIMSLNQHFYLGRFTPIDES